MRPPRLEATFTGNMRQEIERLEAEAFREVAPLGLRHYFVVCGLQRWGAWLFGVNVLLGHALGFADPNAMNFPDLFEAFVGFHLTGGAIALFLWSRNSSKYGRDAHSPSG